MDNSKYEGVRAKITETISLLDKLIEKIGVEANAKEDVHTAFEFVRAYHSVLRQAALDGERYKRAGEAIYKRISSFAIAADDNEVRKSDCEDDYLRGFNFYEAAFSTEVKAIVETYRQAVEQKEV